MFESHVRLNLYNEYNVKDLPYVLPLMILESGNALSGSKKVKSFTGLASDDFAIKAPLYRNRSIKFLI
jgi:hypothetical protein